MNGPEILEGEFDFGGWDGVAPVPEHLEEGSAGEVVSVALGAAFVDVAAQAPAVGLPVQIHVLLPLLLLRLRLFRVVLHGIHLSLSLSRWFEIELGELNL